MTKSNFRSLLAFFALILILQMVASAATYTSIDNWYLGLKKTSWNPPDLVFGPVWTTLYLMIAISGWRIWVKIGQERMRHPAMVWYFIQLALNLLWSIVFFGLQSPIAGLVDIILLLIAIFMTIKLFFPINKTAAILLVPYFIWVMYASTLNAGIVYLN
jgi:tryptophan-rich sensory protein